MKKYEGKTLLVLGSNIGAKEIVLYAQQNGAKVIVADYYPMERSEAKQYSDLQLMASTADIDAIVEIVKEYHVDGILSGISEFNLQKAMEVAAVCGLPFYCDKAQWEAIEHKNQFRALCEKHGVPHPKTYYSGTSKEAIDWDAITYPAVVKPVDACTSAGVHICQTQEELNEWLDDAFNCSGSGRIIIEQFAKGKEFTAHYTIVNGKAVLDCVDNRYPVSLHEGRVTTIPIARVYPSVYLQDYLDQVNGPMIELCESLGVKNGILFIQGLFDEETGKFHIFEAGMRSAGEAPFRFVEKVNAVNPMSVLVDQALSVESDYVMQNEDPYLHGKHCGVISYVVKGGTVGKITGLEEAVRAVPRVVAHECRYKEGSTTPDTDTLRQLMIRFLLICDSRKQMADDIRYLNEHVQVYDENGNEMVVKFEPDQL